MQVGIVGSKEYPYLDDVREFVRALASKYPQTTVVSGGAKGVDSTCETVALECGLAVISLRPTRIHDMLFGVDEWHLGIEHPYVVRLSGPADSMWEEWRGAAWWRNKLIAQRSDQGVAFWDGRSFGTSDALDSFKAEEKPIIVYKKDERFAA